MYNIISKYCGSSPLKNKNNRIYCTDAGNVYIYMYDNKWYLIL